MLYRFQYNLPSDNHIAGWSNVFISVEAAMLPHGVALNFPCVPDFLACSVKRWEDVVIGARSLATQHL